MWFPAVVAKTRIQFKKLLFVLFAIQLQIIEAMVWPYCSRVEYNIHIFGTIAENKTKQKSTPTCQFYETFWTKNMGFFYLTLYTKETPVKVHCVCHTFLYSLIKSIQVMRARSC